MIVTYCLTDFPEVIPDSLMRAIATAGSGENGKILKDALIVAHTEELKLFLSKALEFSKMSGLPITAIRVIVPKFVKICSYGFYSYGTWVYHRDELHDWFRKESGGPDFIHETLGEEDQNLIPQGVSSAQVISFFLPDKVE